MKKHILIIPALMLFSITQAQEIPRSYVPSVVLNNFETQFPKATEAKWEIKDRHYLVSFEMGRDVDHEVWYNTSGEMVKHKEEIEKAKLPAAVMSRISSDFEEYRIGDAEKLTTDGKVFYEVELDAFMKDEWKITLDAKGTILNKVAD